MPSVIVKEPKVIIMDMLGTAVKVGFIEKILLPYVKNNVAKYVDEKWADKKFKKDIEKLRKDSDRREMTVKIAPATAPEAEQKTSVINYVSAAIDAKRESSAIQFFRYNMWFEGYKKEEITTPIYSDVAIQFRKWKDLNIKLYVFSNGWKVAIKKFLSGTTHGDLNLMLDGHFDTSEGAFDKKDTYTKLAAKIGNPVAECLFLTKSGVEGLAAKDAGMPTVLVLTNIEKLGDMEKALPRIRTFNELEFGEPPPPSAQTPPPPPPPPPPAGGSQEQAPPPEGQPPPAAGAEGAPPS